MHLVDETISFSDSNNQIPFNIDIEEKVERIVNILQNERQMGDNIVLHIRNNVTVDETFSPLAQEIAQKWNNAFDEYLENDDEHEDDIDDEDDDSPHLSIKFVDGVFQVRIELFPMGYLVILHSFVVDDKNVNEVIRAMIRVRKLLKDRNNLRIVKNEYEKYLFDGRAWIDMESSMTYADEDF